MDKKLCHLLIFPDCCSTGLWGMYEGAQQFDHVSIGTDELPIPLHPSIVDKINIMNSAYDLFGYQYTDQPPKSITTEESFVFMAYEIYEDIKRLHPELAPLLLVPQYLESAFDQQPDAYLHHYKKPGKRVTCTEMGTDPIADMVDQGFVLDRVVPLRAPRL